MLTYSHNNVPCNKPTCDNMLSTSRKENILSPHNTTSTESNYNSISSVKYLGMYTSKNLARDAHKHDNPECKSNTQTHSVKSI